MDNYRKQLGILLSETTAKQRRNLLLSSTGLVLINKAGLVPTEIAFLGIKMTDLNKEAVVILATVVTSYFFLAFFIGWVSDYFVNNQEICSSGIDNINEELDSATHEKKPKTSRREMLCIVKNLHQEELVKLDKYFGVVSWSVIFLDIVLPLVAGIYAFSTSSMLL